MFSLIFPGQGSQTVGMAKNLYNKFTYVKELFHKADEILGLSISKMILDGPQEDLDLTENTQPAIFLTSYSIYQMIKKYLLTQHCFEFLFNHPKCKIGCGSCGRFLRCAALI